MFLNIFESIGDFFSQARETTRLDSLVPLLIGIFIGFVLFVLVYLTTVLTPIKKEERKVIKLNKENDEIIKRIISNAKNQFIEESSTKATSAKFEDLKYISSNIINDIARVYYPNSAHPIYELSVDEMFILNHYITSRIELLFAGKVLKRIRNVKISSVLNLLDMKKKYDENKLVKAVNKAKLPTIYKSVRATLNIINPVYWLKKLLIDTPFVAASNKIALTIIEIIGSETNKVYSKGVFNLDEDNEEIQKTILEIEEMLDK